MDSCGEVLRPATLDPEGCSPEVGSGRVWASGARLPSSLGSHISVSGLAEKRGSSLGLPSTEIHPQHHLWRAQVSGLDLGTPLRSGVLLLEDGSTRRVCLT